MADVLAATLQWHDRFDQSFGLTAADCSELLDWPGKTAPFSEKRIAEMSSGGGDRTIDWDRMNRLRGQVKFETYKGELIGANPEFAAFEETKIVFLMRSAGDARTMRELDGGVIVADALWLSFASFCAQTLFATFPQPHEPDAANRRLVVSFHFAMRVLLYQAILRNSVLEKDKFQTIWETWPTDWDDFDAAIFVWTGLGRFIVAHELAHILHHAPANCTLDAVRSRGIVPDAWIGALERAVDYGPLDGFIYEVEADVSALRMCENHLSDAAPHVRATLFCGVYYMFMCLEELARRVGAETAYPQRTRCIAAYLYGHPLVGSEMTSHTEQQFAGRAKFYFDMSDRFAPMLSK